MKVFISWSGERSRQVANLLRDWLSCVIQAVKPWVSNRDIDRGALWFGQISTQLQDSTVGIICLTQENKTQPWILFEAGALAKGLSTARVCTLLVDLEPEHIKDPLAQFNHTKPDKDSMYALASTLNTALAENGLDAKVLESAFQTYWPQFEADFRTIIDSTEAPPPEKPKNQAEVMQEVLSTVRAMSTRLTRIEQESANPFMMGIQPSSLSGVEEGLVRRAPSPLNQRIRARTLATSLLKEGVSSSDIVEQLAKYVDRKTAFEILNVAMTGLSNDGA
ncbi:toll/interleukin-1 receptor domain-containing protein [Stenotrophomonas maltophilia]|nr:TIR domain-containing protein [Stenotrophomonas geniculata]MCI1075396.1 toll/interleukin-1 receptor domain-containing protein [Stenotrophomonas maltophilia]MCI1087600.1 toll/interleukin-1 receptor domain-containing protein [Stenotrophomonas maltophilia]MCI1116582.1 toll/interleukin-1 receptor domain-containing protein [Stenotrophomonas maltophilia]